MSGTTGSYTPVQNINLGPQAKDDSGSTAENQFLLIDVLANDLGGNAKVLWSLEQNAANLTDQTAAGTKITLASGAQIWFQNGKLAYDPRTSFDHLAAGAVTTDRFIYAIRMSTGVVSYATVTVTITGTND